MTNTEISVRMIMDRWNASLKSFDNNLQAVSDEDLQREIAPGKNRGIYLLGHLIAVNDDMLVFLDMGERQYPELQEPFLKQADKTVEHIPAAGELRSMWTKQCELLKQKFEAVSTEQWFEKHTAVSAEDFSKEPHRNKLNIIITRTSHLQYHIGQFILLKTNDHHDGK